MKAKRPDERHPDVAVGGRVQPQRAQGVGDGRERLASATWRSPSGIESAGTNMDEANVSGKIRVKPIAFAVSGDDE